MFDCPLQIFNVCKSRLGEIIFDSRNSPFRYDEENSTMRVKFVYCETIFWSNETEKGAAQKPNAERYNLPSISCKNFWRIAEIRKGTGQSLISQQVPMFLFTHPDTKHTHTQTDALTLSHGRVLEKLEALIKWRVYSGGQPEAGS